MKHLFQKSFIFLATASLLLLTAGGCSQNPEKAPPNSIWLVMKNESGQHFTNFVLDYGTGQFHYEIFSKGYTFGGWAEIKEKTTIRGRYFDEAGLKKEFILKRDLVPEMIGGRYAVYFDPGDRIRLQMDWPE